MGEAGGVARNAAAALPSGVEKFGQKCANPSCLARSGAAGGQFMRCSGCKERRYCSQHCQVGRGSGLLCAPLRCWGQNAGGEWLRGCGERCLVRGAGR